MKLDKIKFAMVVGFIQRQFAITINANELAELDTLIDIEMPEQSPYQPIPDDVNNLMAEMAIGQRKIEAIKLHRKLTSYGLKDSKDAVERYWPDSTKKYNAADLRSKLNLKIWDATSYSAIEKFIAELGD